MANITYLLGAGASAKALPTYSNFYNRFFDFRNALVNPEIYNYLPYNERAKIDMIKQEIEILLNEFQYHATPDTIAKKYFHQSNDKGQIKRLKIILILFFIYEQTVSNKPITVDEKGSNSFDKRYDAFLASILKPVKGRLKIYDQFKVLTWNYDLQFEIAFSNYSQKSLPELQKGIQSYPLICPEGSEQFDTNRFSILHLNGIAYAGMGANKENDYLGRQMEFNQSILTHIIEIFDVLNTESEFKKWGNMLSFAWEKQNANGEIVEKNIIEYAIHIAEITEVLVIIGYSFPMFNSVFDKKIFSSMRKLRKIYIQSKDSDGVRKQIHNLLEPIVRRRVYDSVIEEIGYGQFYIPKEWNDEDYKIEVPRIM